MPFRNIDTKCNDGNRGHLYKGQQCFPKRDDFWHKLHITCGTFLTRFTRALAVTHTIVRRTGEGIGFAAAALKEGIVDEQN